MYERLRDGWEAPKLDFFRRRVLTTRGMMPGSVLEPCIVCVLPEEVTPYANTVTVFAMTCTNKTTKLETKLIKLTKPPKMRSVKGCTSFWKISAWLEDCP